MSETKRKSFSGELKAKVALEAIRGIRTVNEIKLWGTVNSVLLLGLTLMACPLG